MIPRHSFACLLIVSCFSAIAPALALTQLDTATDSKLSAIETKIFAHAYANETDADRVARVERFVFGSSSDVGTLNERIARLANAVSVKTVADVPYLPGKRAFSEWKPTAPVTGTTNAQLARPTASYPRVTQLEERLFGESYAAEPITKRLDRLEIREFGSLSKSNDLAVRVDTLVSFAVPEPPAYANPARVVSYQPTSINPVAGNYKTNMFGLFRTEPMHRAQASQSYTVVDQIEFLENATFGKTRPNKTLQKRVNALEEKFYGAPKADSNKDISLRVAQLLSLVNNGAATPGSTRSSMNRSGA